MIKNPKLGQTVFFFEEGEIKIGKVNHIFQIFKNPPSVEIDNWYYRPKSEIFPTERLAKNNLKNEISKTLKALNKRIFELSKQREKLASKLAKLIGERG